MLVSNPFQETLWQATDEVFRIAEDYKVELSEESAEEIREKYRYGMRYNEVLRCDVPIERMSGRKTLKWFHAVITRLDSGRYEVVCYPL